MTTKTEGRHAAEFILSEANGNRSRENGTVAQGQTLVAGEVVMLSAGKLVTQDGALDTGGELVTASEGIILDNVDTSSDGTNADTPAAYIKRDAEVNGNLVTFPPETTDTGERAATVASLASLGIIVRD
jgi:hypothetical protein